MSKLNHGDLIKDRSIKNKLMWMKKICLNTFKSTQYYTT